MIKRFTLLLLLILSFGAKAQLIVYRENFDDMPGYTLSGWHYEFTGMVPWQAGLPALVGGCMLPVGGPMSVDVGTNKVACIPDCGAWNPNDSNVFSYTTRINMTGITGAWLKYDSYYEHNINAGDTERATVEISTDTGQTWTVLQEVPANSSLSNFQTYYFDLSAYNNVPDLRIGFRYSDGGGWMMGWAIDNVTVFVPAKKDLSLLAVTPTDTLLSYVKTGYGINHTATVYNAGLDTIHSFVLNYQQGSGPVKSDTITGVTLLPFSTNDFTHTVPDSVFLQGTFKVTMWVSLDSDEYRYNDTAVTYLRGAGFIPVKELAIESGEGTWNGWSPRSATLLSSVPGHDINACLISVHDHDIMSDTVYADFLYNLHWNYVPYMLFDRRTKVPFDSFEVYLQTQKKYFGFASISLHGSNDRGVVEVDGTIVPAVDLHGDFRLALVVTEDGVTGTTSDYDQVNNYAGGLLGTMGGYESLPNPVPAATMTYNYVARQVTPAPGGATGLLPTNMATDSIYSFSLTSILNPAWHAEKLRAIVLLIRQRDSTVLNCSQLPFYLETPKIVLPLQDAGLYPNPANDVVTLFFTLAHKENVSVDVTDLSGKMVYRQPPNEYNEGRNAISLPLSKMAPGLYIVNLAAPDGNKSLKLEVFHR